MSELKRFDIVGKYADEETMYEFRPDGECYDADEVDKKIAELNAEIDRLQKWNKKETKLHMDIESRQKYKRCLAMAKWCFTKSNYHFIVGRNEGGQFAKKNFLQSRLYSKWCDRWKKLAEQFKEDK